MVSDTLTSLKLQQHGQPFEVTKSSLGAALLLTMTACSPGRDANAPVQAPVQVVVGQATGKQINGDQKIETGNGDARSNGNEAIPVSAEPEHRYVVRLGCSGGQNVSAHMVVKVDDVKIVDQPCPAAVFDVTISSKAPNTQQDIKIQFVQRNTTPPLANFEANLVRRIGASAESVGRYAFYGDVGAVEDACKVTPDMITCTWSATVALDASTHKK